MPLNESNFLIWYGPGESEFDTGLPRPFVLEPEVLSPVVWLVPGEKISFCINSTNNTAPTGPVQIVHEIDAPNTRRGLLYSISTIKFPTGEHTFGSITVPVLGEGFVHLTLGQYRTQTLFLTSSARAADRTAVVRFRNGDRLQNYRYKYLPADFYQQFRIRLSQDTIEPEVNKTTYRGGTTGQTRHLYSEPRSIVTFSTPEYNLEGHRAMVSMMEHDEIYINGQRFAFAQAYKANTNKGDALSTGEFSMSDEKYATLHRA